MCLLIENSETHEYLTVLGKWSKNPLEGKSFASTTLALTAVHRQAIEKFNLVFLDAGAIPYLTLTYH